MELRSKSGQRGVSLTGLIFGLAIMGVLAVLAMKIFPTYTEYMGVKKAIVSAKKAGTTPAEVRTSFDKQAEVGYISSISSKDLELTPTASGIEVSFAYQKKIPLVGPASLVLDYEGTTSSTPLPKPAPKL